MKSNPIVSAVVGAILISILVGTTSAVLFGLEKLCDVFTNKNVLAFIISAPVIAFVAYLIGDGLLENRRKQKSHG